MFNTSRCHGTKSTFFLFVSEGGIHVNFLPVGSELLAFGVIKPCSLFLALPGSGFHNFFRHGLMQIKRFVFSLKVFSLQLHLNQFFNR